MNDQLTIDTPRGLARVHLTLPDTTAPRAALVLGHGAGGGVGAPDLQTAVRAATGLGLAAALVEQPYRVAGRRSPAPAPALDEAWAAVIGHLRAGVLAAMPVITGGRSSGARVACRTATATAATAVLCLAFPLLPPARAGSARVPVTRLPELEAVRVPVLIVQGSRDRFGMPPAGGQRTVVTVTGDHGLKTDQGALHNAIEHWLTAQTALTT